MNNSVTYDHVIDSGHAVTNLKQAQLYSKEKQKTQLLLCDCCTLGRLASL